MANIILDGIVTNDHHFNHETSVTFSNGAPTEWHLNKRDIFPSPTNVSTLITKLHLVFQITGIDYFVTYGKSAIRKFQPYTRINGTLMNEEQFVVFCEVLYSQPLEIPITLLKHFVCGCNMGECGGSLGYSLEKEVKTYGDVMNIFGGDYPDSVMLRLERVTEEEVDAHDPYVTGCNLDEEEEEGEPGPRKKVRFIKSKKEKRKSLCLDPDANYVSWGYYR
jgi:hypothetical protein